MSSVLTRTCKACAETKPLESFRAVGSGAYKGSYRRKTCLACDSLVKKDKYAIHKDKWDASRKRWVASHPDKVREYGRRSYQKKRADPGYRKRSAEYQRAYCTSLRQEMLDHYGRRCACPGCPETLPSFLTLEHVGGGGAEHRASVGNSNAILADLKKRGWPKDGFTVLCMSCNVYTYRNGGECPHVTEQAAAFKELREAVRLSWQQEAAF